MSATIRNGIVRAGGTAVWAPRILPPTGVNLTPQRELACAFRVLARSGFSENIAGHITMAPVGSDVCWTGAVRALLRAEPDILH